MDPPPRHTVKTPRRVATLFLDWRGGGRRPSTLEPSARLLWRIAAAGDDSRNDLGGRIRLDSQDELFGLISRLEEYGAGHDLRRVVVTFHPLADSPIEYHYGCWIRSLLRSLAWRRQWIVHIRLDDDGKSPSIAALRRKLAPRLRIIGLIGARNLTDGAVFYQGRPIALRAHRRCCPSLDKDRRAIIPFAPPMVAVCPQPDRTPPNPQRLFRWQRPVWKGWKGIPWPVYRGALARAGAIAVVFLSLGAGAYRDFADDREALIESENLLKTAASAADSLILLSDHLRRLDSIDTPHGRLLAAWQGEERRRDRLTEDISNRLAERIVGLFHRRIENRLQRLETKLFPFDPRDDDHTVTFLDDLAGQLEVLDRRLLDYRALGRGNLEDPYGRIIEPAAPRLPAAIGQSASLNRALIRQSARRPIDTDSHAEGIARRLAQIVSRHIARRYDRDPLLRYFRHIEKNATALEAHPSPDHLRRVRQSLRDLVLFQGGYARFGTLDAATDPDIQTSFRKFSESAILSEDFPTAVRERLDDMAAAHRQRLVRRDVPILGSVIVFDADGTRWDVDRSARAGLALLDALFAAPLTSIPEEDAVDRLRQLTAFRQRFDWDANLLQHSLDGYTAVRNLENIPDVPEKLRLSVRRVAIQAFFRRIVHRVAEAVRSQPPSLQRRDDSLPADSERTSRIVEIFSRLFAMRDVHASMPFAGYDILQWAALSWSYRRLEDMTAQLENSAIFAWPEGKKNGELWQKAGWKAPSGTPEWLEAQKKALIPWVAAAEPLVRFTQTYRPLDSGDARSFWQQLIGWVQDEPEGSISLDARRYYDLLSRFAARGDPCFHGPRVADSDRDDPRNFFRRRLDDFHRTLERRCRHLRRSSPVPVLYNSLVDAFQTTLSGRYPFADTSAPKDARMKDVRDFFSRFAQKAPTIRAFLQNQDGDSPDRLSALSFIERMQSTHTFLDPFLTEAKDPDSMIRVHLDIGSDALSGKSRGGPDRVEISVGNRNFTVRKDLEFAWRRGENITLRLIWNPDAEFLPTQRLDNAEISTPDRRHEFVVTERGEWSLLRLIERYGANQQTPQGWTIRIPVTLIARKEAEKAFPRPYDLTFSILFRLSVGDKEQGWRHVSTLPSFPRNIAKIPPNLLR